MNVIRRIVTILLVAVMTVAGAEAQQKGKPRSNGGRPKTEKPAGRGAKKSNSKGKTSGQKQQSKTELQRQQKATQQEIAETKRKIQENERQVSRNLAELNRLQGDIEVSKGKVSESSRRVNVLQGEIAKLQGQIAAEQKEITRLRSEYLKAVKAVRKRKNSNSDLAYIFSSKSLTDAARRMRYLREFAEWRDKQTSGIQSRIKDMEGKKQALSQNKTMYDKALAVNVAAQKSLEAQYGKKDAIVVELKANGTALRSHLAKKQAEVNDLKGRVSALIAAEQAAAERKAAEQRAAEQRAAEKRAAEQREAEQRAAREAERQRQQELAQARQEKEDAAIQEDQKQKTKSQKESVKKNEEPKQKEQPKKQREQVKKEQPRKQKEQPKKEAPKSPKREDNSRNVNNNTSYAEARNRRPRRDGNAGNVPAVTKAEGNKATTGNTGGKSFASMRGSLPRPVAGAFRVTSPFGVHSLPDMPEVKFDNPGIDAEVAKGAAAQAVYAGRVSGVYRVSGFSTVVIVNHGDYYTVYGNLSSASVKVRDNVKAGQTVGTVADGEDSPGRGQIHFEVWKNREKQDPMAWIR